MRLAPQDPAVLFALAFTNHLMNNLNKAIELYHEVVVLKYDTHFVNHMLSKCLSDLANK